MMTIKEYVLEIIEHIRDFGLWIMGVMLLWTGLANLVGIGFSDWSMESNSLLVFLGFLFLIAYNVKGSRKDKEKFLEEPPNGG